MKMLRTAINSRRYLLAFLSTATLMVAGCWQEIHYVPSADDEKPPISEPTASERVLTTNQPEASDAVETDRTLDTTDPEPTVVTADDLFGDTAPPADAELEPQEEPSDSGETTAQPETDVDPDIVDAGDQESDDQQQETPLAIWRMASRWSFAAAVYAKGQPEEHYRDALDQAGNAARLIDVPLPEFPVADPSELEQAVINELLAANLFSFDVSFSPEHRALAELATKTHLLLLVYTPKSSGIDSVIDSLRTAALQSELPEDSWTTLIGMLEGRQSFADVKREVFDFHQRVDEFLSGSR